MKNVVYFHGIHGDTQKSIAPFLEKEFAKLNIKFCTAFIAMVRVARNIRTPFLKGGFSLILC